MIYEVIFVDEYDNFYHLGFFKDLKKALEPINEMLPENYKIENLQVYGGTYEASFDKVIMTGEGLNQIRGFVWDEECLRKEINNEN